MTPYTAHIDTFVRDRLPPPGMQPRIGVFGLAPLDYPARLNTGVALLDDVIAEHGGDRIALRTPDAGWTYAALRDLVDRIARVLTDDLRLVPGERVLLRGFNSPMMAACWFATLKAGGIAVSTMPLLRARELATIISKAQTRVALVDGRLEDELQAARATTPALQQVLPFGTSEDTSLDARLAGKEPGFTAVATSADDPAILAFTSGTTGVPKAAVHTHRDLLASCDTFSRWVLQPRPDDLFVGSPPLAFTYGLGGLILFPFRAGAASLLLEQAPPPKLLEAIAAHRPTICFTAPTAYRAMTPAVASSDVSSLRLCVSAGETLPRAVFDGWREATGLEIIDGIGSTELLHIFIASPPDEIRPGSTGRVVPGYRARIVDEAGNVLPPGIVGRLAVQGPTGCRYLDDAERQAQYVQNGWNFTGDAYAVDEDGYFWYHARTDDLIVSAGYNIAGPEVENVLLDHPKVAECAVVGAPDPERGQVVAAYVVLRDPADACDALVEELQRFVKAQIAPYKYPRQVTFLTSLPRTNTGKLQRFKLRAEAGSQ